MNNLKKKQHVTFPGRVRYEKAQVQITGDTGAYQLHVKNPKSKNFVETHYITGYMVGEDGETMMFVNGNRVVATSVQAVGCGCGSMVTIPLGSAA